MPDPQTPEEAVFAALIMFLGRKPRANAGEAFIRLLEQDGFTVTHAAGYRVVPLNDDVPATPHRDENPCLDCGHPFRLHWAGDCFGSPGAACRCRGFTRTHRGGTPA